MKKKIFTLLALFAGVLGAYAEDVITVSSALIPEGKSGTFGIELTNEGGYSGFQVDLNLPDGVTFVSVAKTERIPDDWTFADSNPSTGVYRVLGHFNKAANPIITGNSGDFLIVTVSLDAEKFAKGDKIACSLTNMEVTPTGTTTAQKVADYNFNIEVTDRVVIDENSTVSPVAQSGVNVTVKRSIKANTWSTIVLPFTMTQAKAKAAFGDDATYATLKDFTTTIDMETLTPTAITLNFTKVTLSALVPLAAGTPYLIKTTKDIESFDVDNVTIATAVKDKSVTDTDESLASILTGKFTGSLVKTVVPKNGLFISGNKFYYSTGKTNIKALRGWFELVPVVDQAIVVEAPVIDFVVDGETTQIDAVRDINVNDGKVYNLKGQHVENPTEKGVYIKNGKKFVIK